MNLVAAYDLIVLRGQVTCHSATHLPFYFIEVGEQNGGTTRCPNPEWSLP